MAGRIGVASPTKGRPATLPPPHPHPLNKLSSPRPVPSPARSHQQADPFPIQTRVNAGGAHCSQDLTHRQHPVMVYQPSPVDWNLGRSTRRPRRSLDSYKSNIGRRRKGNPIVPLNLSLCLPELPMPPELRTRQKSQALPLPPSTIVGDSLMRR